VNDDGRERVALLHVEGENGGAHFLAELGPTHLQEPDAWQLVGRAHGRSFAKRLQ